jgi:hypothetical protein
VLAPLHLGRADRARRDPPAPAGRIVQRPFGQVQVEAPDAGQGVEITEPFDLGHGLLAGDRGDRRRPRAQPLLPRGGDLARKPQRADAGVVLFNICPEASDELVPPWGPARRLRSWFMPQNFLCPQRDQPLLLPVDMREWLPEDDLVFIVLDAVAALDLGGFRRRYRADGHGRAAFDPEMMVALLLYAC